MEEESCSEGSSQSHTSVRTSDSEDDASQRGVRQKQAMTAFEENNFLRTKCEQLRLENERQTAEIKDLKTQLQRMEANANKRHQEMMEQLERFRDPPGYRSLPAKPATAMTPSIAPMPAPTPASTPSQTPAHTPAPTPAATSAAAKEKTSKRKKTTAVPGSSSDEEPAKQPRCDGSPVTATTTTEPKKDKIPPVILRDHKNWSETSSLLKR